MSAEGRVVLALETSGTLGSVAVSVDGEVRARRFLLRRADHAAALVPGVESVLSEARVDRRDVTSILVGAGPGSFTGVRVAAATANGLATALGVELGAVNSLMGAAVSAEALPPTLELSDVQGVEIRWNTDVRAAAERRAILFDARGDRVYAARVRIEDGEVTVEEPPRAATVGEVLNAEPPADTWFAGDGALEHEPLIRAAGYSVRPAPVGVPTADGLIRILAWAPEMVRWVEPGSWEPDYVRDSSAVPPVRP